MSPKILAALLLFATVAQAPAAEQLVDPVEVRQAIQRSLPFLEEKGVWWMEEKKCVSCHRVSFLTWPMTDAARLGIGVNQEDLDKWLDWSLQRSLEKREKDGTIVGSTNLDGVGQLILGRSASQPTPDRQQAYASLTDLLIDGQAADGSWAAGGQLPSQKRPATETQQVSTMWNTLALASITDSEPRVEAACNKAFQWLGEGRAGQSQEWFVTRYLLERQLGDPDRAKYWLQELRGRQQADGGWAWLKGGTSDALATGQTLYALSIAGARHEDVAVQQAGQFLIDSQREDGSWPVHGTKAKSKDKITETAVYWGTAWAVIGLSRTLSE